MKKIKQATVLLAFASIATASTQNGNVLCVNAKHQHLSSSGFSVVNHCIIKSMHAVGHLKTTHSQFNTLTLIGSACLESTDIKKSTKASGTIDAQDSHFNGPIKIHGNKIYLNHSSANKIYLYSTKSNPGTIKLKNKSVIHGNVYFRPAGTLWLDKGSKIEGKVIGGKIAHET